LPADEMPLRSVQVPPAEVLALVPVSDENRAPAS
jgi:hypothetical protein